MTDKTDLPLPGQPIDPPLPPELAEAFGYRGRARFVGFSWSPAGDEVVVEDGRTSRTGQSWTYLVYKRHPVVAPLLADFNLGYSDLDATHCLVLDRQRNRASIAPLAEARDFLDAQHPPTPPPSPAEAEELRRRIKEAVAGGWQEVRVDPQEVQGLMEEQRRRVGRMVSFLDMCPLPPGRGQGHNRT